MRFDMMSTGEQSVRSLRFASSPTSPTSLIIASGDVHASVMGLVGTTPPALVV